MIVGRMWDHCKCTILNFCSWQATGVNVWFVMQIIQVTHSDLSSQLPGLMYEVDMIFCVNANTRFSKIHENHATCIPLATAFCAVDTSIIFELVSPGSFYSCESLFALEMYTDSGVSFLTNMFQSLQIHTATL